MEQSCTLRGFAQFSIVGVVGGEIALGVQEVEKRLLVRVVRVETFHTCREGVGDLGVQVLVGDPHVVEERRRRVEDPNGVRFQLTVGQHLLIDLLVHGTGLSLAVRDGECGSVVGAAIAGVLDDLGIDLLLLHIVERHQMAGGRIDVAEDEVSMQVGERVNLRIRRSDED